ncbi:MAG: hypothetical protein HYZ43_11715 [Flavobacteriia bacterium]|nr:hypothetical protein [Flavobacteriia bacterium]
MRLCFLITLMVTCLNCVAYSQQLSDMHVGPELNDKGSIISILGKSETNLYTLRSHQSSIFLQLYDAETFEEGVSTKVLVPENPDYYLGIDAVVLLNNRPVLIASGYDLSGSGYAVFGYEFDQNGNIIGKPTTLLTATFMKSDHDIPLSIQISEDETRLFIMKKFESFTEEKMHHSFSIIGEELNHIFSDAYTCERSVKGKTLQLVDMKMDELNSLHILQNSSVYSRAEKCYVTHVKLTSFQAGNSYQANVAEFDLAKGFCCGETRVSATATGIRLVGTYTSFQKKKLNGFRGVFCADIAVGDSFAKVVFTPYSNDIRLKSLRGRDETEGVDVPYYYTVTDCFTDSLNNTYLISERQMITQLQNGLTEYYYGSLIVSKLNATGVVEWSKFVPKAQFFREKGIPIIVPVGMFTTVFFVRISKDARKFLSYKAWLKNGQLHFLFNDNPENEFKTQGQERMNYTKTQDGVPFLMNMEPNGNYSIQPRRDLISNDMNHQFCFSLIQDDFLYVVSSLKAAEQLQRFRL